MLSPATQAESLGCFSQRSQNVLAVKPPPGVPGLLAREVLRVGVDVEPWRAPWRRWLHVGGGGWRLPVMNKERLEKASFSNT